MDEESYRIRRDTAVTVGCRLETGELALVWTTTPWTLPSNLATAVGPDIDYVVVESDYSGRAERYILAEARLGTYAAELFGDAKMGRDDLQARVLERMKGTDLVGRHYTPPFSYYLGHPKSHVVLPADYVTTDDGSGLVHIAPAFGEDDKLLTDQYGIVPVVPVAADGRFTYPVNDYEGLHVFDANAMVVEHLKGRTHVDGLGGEAEVGSTTEGTVLLRKEVYEHSYPHCWRCREPLMYMAVSSWFVEVTRVKDRMGELNQEITWVPEHVKDGQFGKWVANARDWSISRNRFWGSPIPVWRSDDPAYPRIDVYGSFEELERDFGVTVTDLHRPFVDHLTRPNPDDPSGNSTMRRVEDVLDVWFDSGSMSFAQVHYPFDNADWFEHHFPGDFIVEYIGQTRGWFYTLHILATAIFDRPAFSSCMSHGIVLGNDGQKMSKSLSNYPDVTEVFNRDGADAMRWFLMASPILRGGNLVVTEEGIREGVRQVIIPLWNSWSFFSLYANALNLDGQQGYEARWSVESTDPLDRYLLAKARGLVDTVEGQMDLYDIPGACESVRQFVDVLTNWYIRRSRERFWLAGDFGLVAPDAQNELTQAFDTLYTTLEVLTRVAAPLLPLVSEEIWRGLTGERSVHLTDWPDASVLPSDDALVAAMDQVRAVCSAASSLRKGEGLRVRLPLPELTVVTADAATVRAYAGIVADEVNVKSVRVLDVDAAHESDFGITQRLSVNARAAGPRLGKDVQVAIRGGRSGDWSLADDGTVVSGGIALVAGEFTLETVVAEDSTGSHATAMLPGGGFVVLDTAVTPALALEGIARDLVRAVQQARRDAGLEVSDRISLSVSGGELVQNALREHRELVASETLAQHLTVLGDLDGLDEGDGVASAEVGDERLPVRIAVAKA
jgi:isoleucyl-tRNA synthetase